MDEKKKTKSRFNRFLRILGPGLITGAADDDPSGIATYSQAGARFGFGMLWAVVFIYPLMVAVQEACARIGAVTGKGLAAVIRDNYSRKILFPIVFLVIIANTINIGANIGAMAASARLIVPIPFFLIALVLTIIVLSLEVFTSYKSYAKILKWLSLFLLAYPLTAIIAGQNWPFIIQSTFTPSLEFNFGFFFILTAVLGTTISPYMFFWEASQEVEEEIGENRISQSGGFPRISKKYLRNIKIDNIIGMFFSNIIAWFIIVTAASVLHGKGVTEIATAAEAAEALEPLVSSFPNSGFLAKTIFASGVIGLGLLAVPILAGSASYALCEALKWREGLSQKFSRAKGFYSIIIFSTLVGLLMNFIGVNPITALVYAAVINGVVSIPLIFMIARISSNEAIMNGYHNGWISKILLWITFFSIVISAIIMFLAY